MEIINKIKFDETQRELMVRLSKRIKSERENRGFDVIELVIRSGVSQATIYNLEAGVQENVGLKNLTGIAMAFEMDVISLLSQ
jgi:transcriptional regulator with XRE-family HTH domain